MREHRTATNWMWQFHFSVWEYNWMAGAILQRKYAKQTNGFGNGWRN